MSAAEETVETVMIKTRVPKWVTGALDEIAREKLGNRSDVSREAIAEYLRARGKLAPEEGN